MMNPTILFPLLITITKVTLRPTKLPTKKIAGNLSVKIKGAPLNSITLAMLLQKSGNFYQMIKPGSHYIKSRQIKFNPD